MKVNTILTRTSRVLALCFVSALAFSGCEGTSEPPSKSDQPPTEHPQKEHPEHPKPAETNK